jgi:hypothetical protein
VCPINGCAECPEPIKGLGYNNCYNKIALGYINDYRKSVGYNALTLNIAHANKAQYWANEFNNRGSGASSASDRPINCASIQFQQTVASKISSLSTNGDAVVAWWDGRSSYDPTTGKPKGT